MIPLDPGLLAAVLADPDDDFVRLVCADWFEERGDPRGEFIRVQVELATTEREDGINSAYADQKCQCPYCKLCRRERELLTEKNITDWFLAGLPKGTIFLNTSRGFPDSVLSSWSDWTTHAAAIRAAQPVRRVKLTTPPPDTAFLGAVTYDDLDGTPLKMRHPNWPGIEFELPPVLYGTEQDIRRHIDTSGVIKSPQGTNDNRTILQALQEAAARIHRAVRH